MISPMAFAPVSLTPTIQSVKASVSKILDYPYNTRHKGPIAVVRGVGGGKTFAMVHCQKELNKTAGMLPLLITFNSEWGTDIDFSLYKETFSPSDPARAYALAVISRMASVYFGVSLATIAEKLSAEQGEIFFTKGLSGSEYISLFCVFLARDKGVRDVVLMVDEVIKGDAALAENYPGHKDAAKFLRHSLLGHDFTPYGIRTALVLSGLMASVAGVTPSDKLVYTFELNENLPANDVVRELFLMGVDEHGRTYPIVARLQSADVAEEGAGGMGKLSVAESEFYARKVLETVAIVLSSLPRCLEFAQDEIRRCVDHTTEPPSLLVTPKLVRQIFDSVMSQFEQRYPALHSAGLPEPRLMFATLYGQSVVHDKSVAKGIMASLFVNSLKPADFIKQMPHDDEYNDIVLRTSILSLNAAMGRCSVSARKNDDDVGDCMRRVFDMVLSWTHSISSVHQIGSTLEDLSLIWMELMLTAAIQASEPHVVVNELLQLHTLPRPGINPSIKRFLKEEITLPTPFEPIMVVNVKASFSCKKGATEIIEELNKIELTEDSPCVLLKSAGGDHWDFGLAFLGAKRHDDGERPVRVILFGNKARAVLVQKAEVDADDARNVPQDQATKVMLAAQQCDKSGRGIGSTIARNEHTFMYLTAFEGDSRVEGNVFIIGREDTQGFFKFMYPFYAAVKAGEEWERNEGNAEGSLKGKKLRGGYVNKD